jgi:hypothetical protein
VATWNSGAHDEFRSYFMPTVHGFYLDGAVLYEGLNPIDEDRALYAAGFKPNVVARQIAIRVYGNTAVPPRTSLAPSRFRGGRSSRVRGATLRLGYATAARGRLSNGISRSWPHSLELHASRVCPPSNMGRKLPSRAQRALVSLESCAHRAGLAAYALSVMPTTGGYG